MSAADTTLLLQEVRAGDTTARRRLFDHLYVELKGLARAQLARGGNRGLQATELLHEAFVKLCRVEQLAAGDRAHFLAVAAGAMRSILVDHYRRRSAVKRGGEQRHVTLDEHLAVPADGEQLLHVDEALERLARFDQRAAKVVELKFFGGLTEPEIAEALEMSVRTVSGDWRRARAWLNRELGAS